jgi:hypothetical protein
MRPQHIVSKMKTKQNSIFSFDFGTLYDNLHLGGPQAAYPSVKGVASSTPPAKKWTNTCRAAQNCIASNPITAPRWDIAQRQILGPRLQARPNAQAADKGFAQVGRFGIGRAHRANMAAPAFFHAQITSQITHLSAGALCDSTPLAPAGQCARRQRGHIC